MIDKKKTYVQPITTILDAEPMEIICTSVIASDEATLSTDNYDDEGDYEAGEVYW
ncbi:hypothetical protein [Prevotella melaninogenica]|uniref:hypothetical protein n=1 Tax=Prevotella melaninogenica TaxID=28132 RepID=UPI0012E09850|nr:hypothetical protein [Prevotella melaninogenica]